MPPTLVASIYGMNFKFMPELDWKYGYPLAIGLMVFAAVLPYLILQVEEVAVGTRSAPSLPCLPTRQSNFVAGNAFAV